MPDPDAVTLTPDLLWVQWYGNPAARGVGAVGWESVFSGWQYGLLDETHGRALPPCELQRGSGQLRPILWPVAAGPATLRIWCQHSQNCTPQVVVRANAALGVPETVVETSATEEWEMLTVTVAPTRAGVLEVVRRIPGMGGAEYWARWDDLSVD